VRQRIALHRSQKRKNKIGNAWITTRTELLTMATHALPASHIIDEEYTPAANASALRPSPMRRFYDAMIEMQMRRAQREIDRVLGPDGFKHALSVKLPPRA
jgi:hypothetical protein